MKVFASDPPEHKSKSHNKTHTHRNHPNLATFRTDGRWCNLEIAQLIVLTCPVCAHLQTRALFGVWLIVKIVIFFVRLCYTLYYCFCSYVRTATHKITVARTRFFVGGLFRLSLSTFPGRGVCLLYQ